MPNGKINHFCYGFSEFVRMASVDDHDTDSTRSCMRRIQVAEKCSDILWAFRLPEELKSLHVPMASKV